MECDGSYCHSECELLHLDDTEKALRQGKASSPLHAAPVIDPSNCSSRLVICAGPERSGSTWLYNGVRLLYRDAGIVCGSYWIHTLSQDKIAKRLDEVAKYGGVVCIKTHEFHGSYADWLVPTFQPKIVLTHRNLHGVMASYRRVGWSYSLPPNYVEHHLNWKEICTLDLKYEDIVRDGMAQLRVLAEHIMGNKVSTMSIDRVHEQLLELDKSFGGGGDGVNQVTKMWPSHVSDETRRLLTHQTLKRHEEGEKEEELYCGVDEKNDDGDELVRQYPKYMKAYGYSKKA